MAGALIVAAWGAATLAEAHQSARSASDMIVNGLPGTLSVTPAIINQTVRPGQTLELKISVRNPTTAEQTATVTAQDIVAGPGDLPLLALHKPAPALSSMKAWLSGLMSLDLAPGAGQTLDVSVAIPADAAPGSHLGAVRIMSAPLGTPVKSQTGGQGTLIFLRVQGAAPDKLTLSHLGTGRAGGGSTFVSTGWFAALPIIFTASVRNEGSVHQIPKGTLNISDMFGHAVAKLPFGTDGDILLPGASGQMSQLLTGYYRPGRYSATVQVPYGQGQKLIAKTSFWVVPLWIWGVALAVFFTGYAFAARLATRRA